MACDKSGVTYQIRMEGMRMNNLDVAGILQAYSQKARLATSTKQLRNIVSELKQELDLRKIKMD